ncbi:MAG TPA: hypothetical protein VJ844_12250 [Mucilaginibacter sp.]|nr:hypothetical protein [Mucilaginibacter sp.]
MKPQGKKPIDVPKAEPRGFLPCSNDVNRGSALGFKNQESHTDLLLETLAELIVEVYFHERNKNNSQ